MAKYLPKAEKMFQQKLSLRTGPIWVSHNFLTGDECDPSPDEGFPESGMKILLRGNYLQNFNFNSVAELFFQYGMYLLLISEDENDTEEVIVESSSSLAHGLR